MRVDTHTGKYIEDFAILSSGNTHASGGKWGKSSLGGQLEQAPMQKSLPTMQMPLKFDVHIFWTERSLQPLHSLQRKMRLTSLKSALYWPFVVTGERYKPFGKLWQLFPKNRRISLRTSQMRASEQMTKVAIARFRANQHRENTTVGQRKLSSGNRAHPRIRGRLVKARDPVNAVTISQG
jgi:hypothetical protein